MSKVKTIWSDRRRRLGMPLSFTRYSLSEDRLFYEVGFLNTRCEEILLYRVRDISLKISLYQRIFGVGTITIQSSDKTMPTLELKNIKNPRDTKELIHETVEKMKVSRNVRYGEVYNDADHDMDHDGFDDHDFDHDGMCDLTH